MQINLIHLTNSQWQVISKYFNCQRKRKYDLRIVWNAIQYLLKTGCQWRLLPTSYPPWETVYYYFNKWKIEGLYENILYELNYLYRKQMGKNGTPSVGIIDSQSMKTTATGGFEIGYDAGKKVKGRKRHIITDTLGNLLCVEVHSASIADRVGAMKVLQKAKSIYSSITKTFADGGYSGELLVKAKEKLGMEITIVKKPKEGFVVLPKRWIVERTFAWISHDRRNSKDYEYWQLTTEAMTMLSAIKRTLNKITK